jgi:hypothetical protein
MEYDQALIREVSELPFVGTSEAAVILGCEKPRVGRYAKNGLMPREVVKLRSTKVWRTDDVIAFRRALDERPNPHVRPVFRVAPSRPVDLVGTSEAADLLGVERTRIGRWLKNDRMPEPLVRLDAGPIWRRSTIERFADKLAEEAEDLAREREAAAA